ncbi:MAG: glycoside hydrolase family 88 protein [Bryobacteraceae bacterium]|nr:glycoside hydrolase family 88 protein [Bryobacteraceae bacterium]
MLPREQVIDIAARAADRLLAYPWKVWFWGDSIGLEGLLDASALTGSREYQGYVYGLLKGWTAREASRSAFDYTAPGVALLRVFELTGDESMIEAARRHASYMSGFRRTAAGAFVRYENAAIELPPVLPAGHPDAEAARRNHSKVSDGGPCVFVDSVHFDGPFFAKLYQVTGESRYRDLALANILPQIELLYDRNERLFHHFWIERTARRNGVLWGRGNGWAVLGVAQTMEYLGTDDPAAGTLGELLGATLDRLAGLQDECGAWRTVLNDADAYIESSTAAFFIDAICRAVRLGAARYEAHEPVLDRALRFLIEHVGADGALRDVSYETFPSTRVEHYRRMPRGAMVPWGQGPLLTALRSYSDLPLDPVASLGVAHEDRQN